MIILEDVKRENDKLRMRIEDRMAIHTIVLTLLIVGLGIGTFSLGMRQATLTQKCVESKEAK